MVQKGDSDRAGNYQADIPVNAPVEIEIPYKRHYFKILGIVYSRQDGIHLAVGDIVGNFEYERAVTSFMLSDVFPVHEQVRYIVRPFEAQVKTFPFPLTGNHEFLFVISYPAFVIRFAGEGVLCIPRVRDIYPLPAVLVHLMGESEMPVVVQKDALTLRANVLQPECRQKSGNKKSGFHISSCLVIGYVFFFSAGMTTVRRFHSGTQASPIRSCSRPDQSHGRTAFWKRLFPPSAIRHS